jgi:hypothetical protein
MDEVMLLRDLYDAAVTGVLMGVVLGLVLLDLEKRGKEVVLKRPVYVIVLLIGVVLALFGQSKLVAALFDRELTIGFVGACTFFMWVGVWFISRPLYVNDEKKHGTDEYILGLVLTAGGFIFAMGTGTTSSISIMQYGTLVLGISVPLAARWLSVTRRARKPVPAGSQ